MSKSPPVSSRARVRSWTIGKPILRSGSRREMNLCTRIAPFPPFAVSQAGFTRYIRSRKSAELALAPKPLSGIAQKVPSPLSTTPEKPGTTWPSKGPVRPLAGVACAPEAGPGARKSADRVARAVSTGVVVVRGRSAAARAGVVVVVARCSRSTGRGAAVAAAVGHSRPRERRAAVVAPNGDSRIGAPGRSLRGVRREARAPTEPSADGAGVAAGARPGEQQVNSGRRGPRRGPGRRSPARSPGRQRPFTRACQPAPHAA